MQVIFILGLFLGIIAFGVMESTQNSSSTHPKNLKYLAKCLASNVLQYNSFSTQYAISNYSIFHENAAQNPDQVEMVNYVDTSKLNVYDQKNTTLLMNYNSYLFNYTQSSNTTQNLPTLYVVTTWDKVSPNAGSKFTNVDLNEVMSQIGLALSQRVYQSTSTYWTVPWLAMQSDCQIKIMFSELPATIPFANINNFFNIVCKGLINSKVQLGKYIYFQPIYYTPNL